MRLHAVTILAALSLPLSATMVQAQSGAGRPALASAELAAGARLRLTSRAVPSLGQLEPNRKVLAARPSKRTGETLMIVGGAVLLVGLLADETAISIAGVAVGGYGLYVYLDATR